MNADPATRVRLFFAAMADAPVGAHLLAAAQALRLGESSLVPPSHYHLTVAFIGEVAAQDTALLRDIAAAQRAQQFTLRFAAYEYWPKPEVVVAAARTVPGALDVFWQQLHRDLAVLGLALDAKRLRPHVTLARKIAQDPVLGAFRPFDWTVRDFSLVQSDTSGIRYAYTVLDTWQLLDKE